MKSRKSKLGYCIQKTRQNMSVAKTKKQKLWQEAVEAAQPKRKKEVLKTDFKKYKSFRRGKENNDSIDSDDSDEEFVHSQKSLFDEIYDCNVTIKRCEVEEKEATKEITVLKENAITNDNDNNHANLKGIRSTDGSNSEQ